MKRRSLFLCVAAGLVASLAFAAPSQASSVLTTEGSFTLTGSGATATDMEFTYSAGVLPPSSIITINASTTVTITGTSINGNVLEIDFLPVASGVLNFTFSTNAAANTVFLLGAGLTGVTGNVTGISSEGHIVAVNGVPEPASLALLGIGMTGFIALRRFFKKSAVV